VNRDTEKRLIALNRRFYDDFASAFSDSRSATEPGLERIITQIEPDARVLDLGCGQARLARMLPPSCSYVGVDSSEAMLSIAAATPYEGQVQNPDPTDPGTAMPEDGPLPNRLDALGLSDGCVPIRFVIAELVEDRWENSIGRPFDWVVLRAVLHHIPGYDNRLNIVRRAANVLIPGGRMIVANWQFLRIPRLRRRILPWSVAGLTVDDVDPGDTLLDWVRGGTGIRYAHLIDESETRRLAHDASLRISELFYADGRTNDLTLYAVMQ
jgi:SAM-dependent methyltransferase